jgi:hypothetical protein
MIDRLIDSPGGAVKTCLHGAVFWKFYEYGNWVLLARVRSMEGIYG